MHTITPAEFAVWMRYRNKYGSLNPANRQEYMLAQLTTVVAASNGADVDIYDFAPSAERPTVEASEALAMMTG